LLYFNFLLYGFTAFYKHQTGINNKKKKKERKKINVLDLHKLYITSSRQASAEAALQLHVV